MATSATTAYLDIYIGHREEYDKEEERYEKTGEVVKKSATIYGFPEEPEKLSTEQQEILKEVNKSFELLFAKPKPLLAGRLTFELDPANGLSKTVKNFVGLCTGERGVCKNARDKKLHYLGCPIHRIVSGFVAQGGDVTRGDGSGGESIYGGKFNDDKTGLKAKFKKGSLAMANSGKNTNSSQFFVVLTDDETKLAKLDGKYVLFGQLRGGWEALDALDTIGGGTDGKPAQPAWVGGCGIL